MIVVHVSVCTNGAALPSPSQPASAITRQHSRLQRDGEMPDTNAADDWIQFANQPPKRKRAEAVCVACHSKKIKCDVQKRSEAGQVKCSPCDSSSRNCQVRASQRGRRRRAGSAACRTTRPVPVASPSASPPAISREQTADQANCASSITADRVLLASNASMSRAHQVLASDTTQTHIDARANVTFASPDNGIGSHNSHADGVDAGYLQVYGPENQRDADMQALQAHLQSPPATDASLPFDSSLQSTFVETFWDCCYCFCPVLDRATVRSEIARSPLLANAMALAASHVQPPLLHHDGPEEYYNKARLLFYGDGENDSLITLKALSLFYWWAPRPPSTIHRHTSWWWQSVIIRHAQQMGFHREPPLDSPLRARLDLSTRRRIWWTAYVSMTECRSYQ